MNRRQMVQVAASTALAHSVITVLGCAAETKTPKVASGEKGHEGHAPEKPIVVSPVTKELAEAASRAAHCATVGETCLEHCIRSLSSGSQMMADCAKTVQQMIAMCRAMASLAAMGSPHAKALAKLCADVCGECKATCEPHAGHHEECKACFESCQACEAACRAIA